MRTTGERARREQAEEGAVTVLVAGALVLLAVLSLLVVRVGVATGDRARAQAAADAAALAGVVDGAGAAVDLAARNGGTLVGWADDGDEVEVVVALGGARAVARARRLDPQPPVLDTVPDTVPVDTVPVDTVPVEAGDVDLAAVARVPSGPDERPPAVLYALPAPGL